MWTNDKIELAYAHKAEAIRALADNTDTLIRKRNVRAGVLAIKIENGLYEGCTNDTQRKAAVTKAMSTFDDEIDNLEADNRRLQMEYDLAANTVRMIEALIAESGPKYDHRVKRYGPKYRR